MSVEKIWAGLGGIHSYALVTDVKTYFQGTRALLFPFSIQFSDYGTTKVSLYSSPLLCPRVETNSYKLETNFKLEQYKLPVIFFMPCSVTGTCSLSTSFCGFNLLCYSIYLC